MHCRQCIQLAAVQPTPTRWPTFNPLAAAPTAVTRPTTSCPRMAGYWEMPQSLFKHREIRMAEAAVFDRDFDVFIAKRTEVDVLEDQLLLRRRCNP